MSLPYSSFSSGPHVSDVIAYDVQQYSRDIGTVAAGSGAERPITTGMVIAQTATGEWVQLDVAAVDGTEVAAGIARNSVTAADGADAVNQLDVEARHATAKADGLIWPAGISGPEQTTALAELAALGIIVK